MMNTLSFNHKVYSFNKENLKSIFKCQVYNSQAEEASGLFVLSFVTNSICKKTYEQLKSHEFVLKGYYNLSNLLCNIENRFGKKAAQLYANLLKMKYHKDEADWDALSSNESIDLKAAMEVGKEVFTDDEYLTKFYLLLCLVHLFGCVQEDYEQSVEDMEDYQQQIFFANGIGVKKLFLADDGIKLLVPLEEALQTKAETYLEIAGILVAPIIYHAVMETDHSTAAKNDELTDWDISMFKSKFRRITGLEFDELDFPGQRKQAPVIDFEFHSK